jgi:predicted ATPase
MTMGHHDPLAQGGGPGLVRDRLAAAIGQQRVLLVLDNCEHVIHAAAELAGGLLGACPRLVVMATSRQSLGVAGERLVEVGSLDLPADEGVAAVVGSGAGALFVERAQAVHPRFQLDPPSAAAVAETCRRLEGLPLAIELAAARARLLTAAQIAERLDGTLALLTDGHGGEERHHTIRAALVWSYDLLSEAEQMLFRRLAAFRSSFILEAAAAVAPDVSDDILTVLGGLVDKSLVAVIDGPGGQRRFRLLEPVRQFAAGLLQASGERDDAARRHRRHLLSRLPDPGNITAGSAAYEELVAEVDNLRAAVDDSLRASEAEDALTMITAYWWWWENLGLIDEHLDLLDVALEAADPDRMSIGVLALALQQASTRATYVGRVEKAAAFAEQLAELRDQHLERRAVRADCAFALATLNWCKAGGDLSLGNRLMREAQDLANAAGQPILAAYSAGNIVMAAIWCDSVVDADVNRAIKDCTDLGNTAGLPTMALFMRVLDSVLRVMQGAADSFPSCVDAFAELDALDGGWLAEWGGLCVGIAAELVGDQPVAAGQALRFVRFCRRSGVRVYLSSGIRGAARLSATAGYPDRSLRLWGGAEHIESVTGMRYMPLMERLDRPLRQQCTDALEPDAIRLLAEGASWSVAEATQHAEEALLMLQADNNKPAVWSK